MKRVPYLSTHFAPTLLLKFLLTMGVLAPRSALQCLRTVHSLCSDQNRMFLFDAEKGNGILSSIFDVIFHSKEYFWHLPFERSTSINKYWFSLSLENDLDRLLLSRILRLSSVVFLKTKVVFNGSPGCVKIKKNWSHLPFHKYWVHLPFQNNWGRLSQNFYFY